MRHVFPICGLQGFDPIWHFCQLLERRSSGTSNPLRVGIVVQYSFLEHALNPPGFFFGWHSIRRWPEIPWRMPGWDSA